MDERTTRTDRGKDSGIVDLGYHYPVSGMFATGWHSPRAEEGDWGYGDNAYFEDEVYALCFEEEQFYYSFDIDIPESATIQGIEVGIKLYHEDSGIMACALSWDLTSPNPFDSPLTPHKFISFDATNAWHYYGGATDTWGRTWTASELDNGNFAVDLAGSYSYVDAVKVRIFYAE